MASSKLNPTGTDWVWFNGKKVKKKWVLIRTHTCKAVKNRWRVTFPSLWCSLSVNDVNHMKNPSMNFPVVRDQIPCNFLLRLETMIFPLYEFPISKDSFFDCTTTTTFHTSAVRWYIFRYSFTLNVVNHMKIYSTYCIKQHYLININETNPPLMNFQ